MKNRYTPALAERICAALETGASLREVLRQPGMPARATVYNWLLRPEREDFRALYSRARETGLEQMADEILAIADQIPTDNVAVQHQRLQVDARKWLLSKQLPRKYGDVAQLTGVNGEPILISDSERAAKIQALLNVAVLRLPGPCPVAGEEEDADAAAV